MEKYQEINPSNSRIIIDYKRQKPKVKFIYVNKKPPIHTVRAVFYMLWLYVFIIIFAFVILNISVYKIIYTDLTKEISIDKISLQFAYIFLLLMYVPPLVLTCFFHRNKRFLRLLPKINKILNCGSSYYFKKIDRIDKKIFELPIFQNVFLEYSATKDFSKYLKKAEIVEHDVDFYHKSSFSKKMKKEKNDFYWKARFTFEKIPKNGELKIWFY